MKPFAIAGLLTGLLFSVFGTVSVSGQQPVISNLSYGLITENSVTITWNTDIPADSRVFWMVSDSNDQPAVYTDSIWISGQVMAHSVQVSSLQAATMYRYLVVSGDTANSDSAAGYFITRSASTGGVTVWFNHSVDKTVSTGLPANGNTNFQNLFREQIEKARYSIDMTLWAFDEIDSVADYLIMAKERGVKIRFVYNYTANTPQIDTLLAHGIQIVKRNFDTSFTMHDKFWIFDHRYNTNPSDQYLWTGSTNITHAQFHQDRNNIIIIQDQSLCEVYTREFEQMWGSHTDSPDISRSRFGTEKQDCMAHILNVAGTRMEVYFAPTDSIADTLISIINTKPVKSIYFCMLKFTYPSIETALHEVFLNAMQVSGVFDSSCSVRPGSAYPRMKGENVPGTWHPPADVFIDTIKGLTHHKYSLINADTTAGEKIITTGSFDWETGAQAGSDNNMLVIYDATINNLYFQEFMARYRESGGNMIGTPWGIGKLPGDYGAFQLKCQPNPFGDKTTIQFSLSRPEKVRIDIYNATGTLLKTVTDMKMASGSHLITLDGNNLPAGLLLCRIIAGSQIQTGKLLHLTEQQ